MVFGRNDKLFGFLKLDVLFWKSVCDAVVIELFPSIGYVFCQTVLTKYTILIIESCVKFS